MPQIHNERTKLLANALDRASTACFTVGIATPVAGYVYNISNLRDNLPIAVLVVSGIVWILACIALHLIARKTLGGIR